MLSYILSIIASIISVCALIVSILYHTNNVNQPKIMQEQLKTQQKTKPIDESINTYTVKLDAIKNSLDKISHTINDLKQEK